MLDHLPGLITYSLAAQLVGLSYKTFMARFISNGRVEISTCMWDRSRSAVRLDSLEEELDRKFTLAELQAADAGLKRKRDYMKRYRRRQ